MPTRSNIRHLNWKAQNGVAEELRIRVGLLEAIGRIAAPVRRKSSRNCKVRKPYGADAGRIEGKSILLADFWN